MRLQIPFEADGERGRHAGAVGGGVLARARLSKRARPDGASCEREAKGSRIEPDRVAAHGAHIAKCTSKLRTL